MDDAEREAALSSVRKTFLVLSGKGGVGKSTVAVNLALSLQLKGLRVGILDIDLCGPSIPKMLNVEDSEVSQCEDGWLPVTVGETLSVMSIGFLMTNKNEAVVWRGPKKNAMIKQFLTDVAWGDLDALIIDTPPGTSDEHITVMESLRESATVVTGAVLVTTPQAVAVGDVRRELTFCKRAKLKVIGIVENMSGYICPNCSECSNIFSKGGGKALAEHAKVPFLGCVPIDPNLCRAAESGRNYVKDFADSGASKVFMEVADRVL